MNFPTQHITEHLSEDEFNQLFKLLLKGTSKARVLEMLLVLLKFEVSDPQDLTRALFSWEKRIPRGHVEALEWIAVLNNYEKVAEKLGVNERTIRRWKDEMTINLNVNSKNELISIAKNHGLGKQNGQECP